MLYLVAVAFGGTLLGASVVTGGKDAGDGTTHADHHGDLGAAIAWFPAASLRFWTFLFAFGGGVGALLTVLGVLGPVTVGMAALGTGWVTGVGADATVRALSARSTDSTTDPAELVGVSGQLLLGAGPDEAGKVRVNAKGRVQDFIAVTEDETLVAGEIVLVVSSRPDGRLVVTKGED